MTYVDELRRENYLKIRQWCHMTADTLDELHEMAQRIGLRREWFQDHPVHPHYDLRPAKRRAAIQQGATEVRAINRAGVMLREFRATRQG